MSLPSMLYFFASSWMRMLIQLGLGGSGRYALDHVLRLLGGESRADEVLGDNALERGGGIDSHVDKAPRDGGVDPERLDEGVYRVAAGIVALGLELLDVDPPAYEARREPRILALAADRDCEVVRRHLQQDAAVALVDDDLARHGGLQGLDHHLARISV